MQNTGVRIRHMGGDHSDFEVFHELFRSSSASFDTEGDDAAGTTRHVLHGALVVLVTGKSGISDPRDLFVVLEELGNLESVFTVPGHTDCERFEAEVEEEGVHRSLDRSEVSHELRCALGDKSASHSEFLGIGDPVIGIVGSGKSRELVGMCHPVEFAAVNDRSAYRCVVSVHIFGSGMSDDICTPLERAAVDGRCKSIVHDERNSMGVRSFGKSLNVKDNKRGIGDRLAKNSFGIRLESILKFFIGAVGIDESEINSHLAHSHVEEVESAAVDSGSADDVISACRDVENTEEVGCLAGRSEHSRSTALQSRDLSRNHIVGGILETCIKVSGCFQIEQFAHVLAGIIFKSCALDDRNHSGLTVFG